MQKGIFSAGTLRSERMLKVLLLPMLAIPSKPILSEVPGLPSLALLTTYAKANPTILVSIIIILSFDRRQLKIA